MITISEFKGKHRFLSNFWLVTVHYKDKPYPSVEHAYQSAKFDHRPDIQELIWNATTPGRAKEIARRNHHHVLPEFFDRRVNVMVELNREKYGYQHMEQLLLDTGDAQLIEGNNWGDVFWGICNGKGENHLGRILMLIRDEIRARNAG